MYFFKGTELVGRGKRKIWTKKGFLVLGKTLPHFFFFKLLSPRDLDYLENILKKNTKAWMRTGPLNFITTCPLQILDTSQNYYSRFQCR